MRNLEFWILAYLLNSLWQVPLLFAAGWLAARALRSAGAAAEHRVWVITLILQSLIPAISTLPWEWLRTLSLWDWRVSRAGEAQVSVVMGSGAGIDLHHWPNILLAAIAIMYAAMTVYFAARFLWRATTLSAIRREAVALPLTGEAARFWARCSRAFAMEDVCLAASSRIFGPVTMGLRRKFLLLPVSIVDVLPDEDLRTVIAHEFAHMQRRDFAKNLLYELVSLPVTYHPLLWLTRASIMESREMVCDQMASAMTGRNEYAQSLLRLASLLIAGTLARTPHAVGIFDANAFERRLMNLTGIHKEMRAACRVALVTACAALGLATCGSALALGIHGDAASPVNDSSPSKAPKQLTVSAEKMSRNLLTKAVPTYPPDAKKAKIQGKVVLSVVIGKDGNVESVRALSGPQELQQSAIDAVRQWTYKPYLLNGDAVEVKTTINVIYQLEG
ncbi:MAG: M56 family metallopeptidase [Acidobacteriaceae bacterium]|jgi:TonB family protein